MKKFLSKISNHIKTSCSKISGFFKKNLIPSLTTFSAAVGLKSVANVYADDEGISAVNIAEGKTLMSSILGIILTIFKYIGILLLAWSVGMLVLAFKNEDADSKSRAMMMMVVSIILIGLGFILKDAVGIEKYL